MNKMTKLFRPLAALVLSICLVSACGASEPWVEVGGNRYTVEIADTPALQARGLMFRDELADDRGMLFIWRRAEPRAFWMRNTRIPLDILYLGSDRRIVGWSLNTPPCRTRQCPSYPSGALAQYVLEVNAGEMERLGVELGDQVRFANLPNFE
ncbi:MAG: DUF192 domain-containing protein [Xanthomonadaceae bacterium]|nr:DUF192 domain-containing protein [Xanthomonadaceae bacterium]